MGFMQRVFSYIWQEAKSLYNIYIMFLGIGISVFCYFVDGTVYDRKGLKRETVAAKVTGMLLFLFAVVVYIITKFF